jgi:hypothetical protein
MITNERLEEIISIMYKYDTMGKDQVLVKLNVEKIDKNWRGSIFYVPHIFKNFSSRHLYHMSKEYLIKNSIDIIPPLIEVDDDLVRFLDGRHDFAVLRDSGCIDIPCIVYLDQLELIKQMFI